jgi:hypothetical protein
VRLERFVRIQHQNHSIRTQRVDQQVTEIQEFPGDITDGEAGIFVGGSRERTIA